jgi:hypothetical protein
LQMKYVGNF